ncbi:uncharacterized protein LOC112058114 [Bicyclus anynana]|uniref:Uncharacterized protein LOC112058114 n=1 Tax=Bicyclus anynana TaxID=110368 RepID=A0ABM3LPY9_BICAN|nr:uncharacterized protein LOC112058114 [Bicyclus anynana]
MPEIPECLSRRYKALDELIQKLNSDRPSDPHAEGASTDDPALKLMCDFWDILKEDPNLNLTNAVHQSMRAKFWSNVTCYRSGCCDDKAVNKPKNVNQKSAKSGCCPSSAAPSAAASLNSFPLNKVLCNLTEAASFDKKCQEKISKLLETQKKLQAQIQVLEDRENSGNQLMKQADCMWSCMEEAYTKKIAESLSRQNDLSKKLKEVEESNNKWRKNKKDLDFQMNNINKCYEEIKEKINEKTSDIKCIDLEIDNFKKHIECNKNDLEVSKKSFDNKKKASDAKMSSIAAEMSKIEKSHSEVNKHKSLKEGEGTKYIKEAREELQKLCKALLKKKLEREDLNAEKEALLLEIDLLIQNCDQCKDKCKNKQLSIDNEIKAVQKEIVDFKVKCTQCHQCIDTSDIRKICTDCPRCLEELSCLNEGDHCTHDYALDCVCMTVKQKFLDNVFDNMYTLLERQVQTNAGKAVADEVLNCLKKSKNGKLNKATRNILQDFILTTVKKNLNLTIVGGAVKTRCEMDADMYNQLMMCLKQVKVTKPVKADQGTEAKKEPCTRWGGTNECNCPKGPKACICAKKAPAPASEPTSCPPQKGQDEDAGEVVICPHKDSTPCGVDCGMHGMPNAVGSEVAAWRPSPCQGPTCQFTNMRAAQCVLGSELLSSQLPPPLLSSLSSPQGKPWLPPTMSILEDQVAGKSSDMNKLDCDCPTDVRGQPRERIIEEVLGGYTEVAAIEKVSYTIISTDSLDARR